MARGKKQSKSDGICKKSIIIGSKVYFPGEPLPGHVEPEAEVSEPVEVEPEAE